jgi:AraC-like DNA-binding protein
MRLVRARPHPALRDTVSAYADFEERTGFPRETREAAGGGVVVIVDLDTGWRVEGERFGSFVGGLYARPVVVRHEGSSRGVQFNLEPPAVRGLLGVPAGELTHRTVPLDALLGADAARLAQRLHAASSAEERFAVLDDLLGRARSRAGPPARPDVGRAWAQLRASGGQMRIDALADTLGCSRRHLAKHFAHEVGVSPKVAARLIRFDQARARVGSVPLARLAADHGFADQAHLAREFRALAGVAPSAFPFVQDEEAAAA